jgi:arginine utilization protein RocB
MDASKRLLMLCNRENGKITRYPENLRILDNGVEHYFVEVTRSVRIQYGLQAYGEEATSLKERMKSVGRNT